MDAIVHDAEAGDVKEFALGGQEAPSVPVLTIAQILAETGSFAKGLGAHQGDTAIHEEIAGEQIFGDIALRLGAAAQEASAANGGASSVDALIVAIDGDGIGRAGCSKQGTTGAGAQAIIGVEKHDPDLGRLLEPEIAPTGDAGGPGAAACEKADAGISDGLDAGDGGVG